MNEDDAYEDFFADDGPDESELPSVDDMIAKKSESDSETPTDYTQHLLLSYLVASPDLWIKCAPIIKSEYFDPMYRGVIHEIEAHLKKYKDMPNAKMLHIKTGVSLDEVKDAESEKVREWVCDSVEEFCRTTAFENFLIQAADTIAEERDRNTLAGMMKHAQDIANMSLHRNLGFEVHKDTAEVLKRAEKDDAIPTGYRFFDRAFSGGLTRPSFNIISCASGDGKSIFMQNILVNAAEAGENCIFYTLELEPAIVIKRFAAMMTDTHIDRVYSHMDTVVHTLRTRRKTDGEIRVVKFPMSGTSMADISSHYLEITMEAGLHYGVVAVDYIDVMSPVENVDRANIHMKDKFVSEEMNDWAHQNHVILWSASQQTKGAQDEKDARQSGVAGGTPKVSTCDNLIIGKRSQEDKEDERWWGHVAKARSSGATGAKIPLKWDAQTQRMTDGDLELFEEANPILFSRKKSVREASKSERVSQDPLAKEQGVTGDFKKESSGKSKKVAETLGALQNIGNAGVENG